MRKVFFHSVFATIFFVLSVLTTDTVVDSTIVVSFWGSVLFAVSMIFVGFAIRAAFDIQSVHDWFIMDDPDEFE
jgi:hypothetical protein